jgi:hypothetical protein
VAPWSRRSVIEAEGHEVVRAEEAKRPRFDIAHQIAAQRAYAAGHVLDREALTGAASVFTKGAENPEAVPPPSATRQWQTDAWGYIDLVGELSNAARIYGNCFRRVNLVGAVANEEGTVSMTFDDDSPEKTMADEATEILAELQSPYGSQAYLMERMGRNTFMVGECFLYLNDAIDGNAGTWEVLSTDELRPISSSAAYNATNRPQNVRWMKYYGPGFNPRQLPDDAFICRIWRPHPRFSRHADSSVRALLEILDEIVLLTREVRGETVSRISSAGVMAIADEFSFPNDDDAQPGTEDFDPFTREIITTMINAIENKGTAAGVAPIVMRGPAELIDKGIKYLSFARPDAAVAMAKRREALERFAQGIELPPEWIFGHASTTFSNAFQITEDAFRLYIEPGLSEVCEALTRGYLWPKLMQRRGLKPGSPVPPEIKKQLAWYDASHLISKPDRTAAAEKAHDAIAISDHAYRQTLGFTEDDAPDDDEIARRIRQAQELNFRVMVRGTDVDLPVVVDPALLQLKNQPGNTEGQYKFPDGTDPYDQPAPGSGDAVNGAPPPAVDPQTGLPLPPAAPPAPAPPGTVGGPAAPPVGPVAAPKAVAASSERHAVAVGILALRVHSAAMYAVEKAVEKVGAKLRTVVPKNPAAAALVSGVSNAEVAATLGPTTSAALLGEWDLSVAGEFSAFSRMVAAWAREHGCESPGDLAEKATALLEANTRARLFDSAHIVDLATFSALVDDALPAPVDA